MEAPNRNTQLFGIPYFRLTVKKMQATLRHYNQPPQGRRLKAGLFRQLQLYAQHHIQNQEERAIIQRFARGEIQGHDMQQEFMDLHRRRQQPPALPVPLVRLVPLARPAARPAARQIRSIRRPVRSLSPVQPPPIQPPPQPPVQPQNVIVLDSDSDSESDCLSVVQTRECAICAEDRRLNEFPVTRPTTLCDHEIMACIECVRRSIEENIHDHSNIACPTCRQGLSFEDVIAHASNEQFERYDRNRAMAFINNDPLFTRCLGPGCNSGQIHSGGDDAPIITCNACGFKTCYVHKLPWHTNLTCAQYDAEQRERTEQEAASGRYLARETKTCPNELCELRIQKSGGCDHMTCSQCRHQFCWECLAPYGEIRRDGNHHHRINCTYYAAPAPARRPRPRVVMMHALNDPRGR